MRLTDVLRLRSKIGKYSIEYANLPMSYILREGRQIAWKTPDSIEYLQKTIECKEYRFGLARPWTDEFRSRNRPGKRNAPVIVEPILNWSFFRGDRVEVLVGKDKGKHGLVNYIVQERNWVIVEGLNCVGPNGFPLNRLNWAACREYRYVGARGAYPGQYMKSELPLLVTTQVSLVDPSDNKATSIEWRFTETGEKVRVSTRTGRIIPIPTMASETIDYKTRATYNEQPKDTTTDEMKKITFEPKVKTFELDIMDEMGIKDDRIPQKTYWY